MPDNATCHLLSQATMAGLRVASWQLFPLFCHNAWRHKWIHFVSCLSHGCFPCGSVRLQMEELGSFSIIYSAQRAGARWSQLVWQEQAERRIQNMEKHLWILTILKFFIFFLSLLSRCHSLVPLLLYIYIYIWVSLKAQDACEAPGVNRDFLDITTEVFFLFFFLYCSQCSSSVRVS